MSYKIPYVIDNINHYLGNVLNELLSWGTNQRMDIASAYFSVRGYAVLRENMNGLRKFRLLLGDEPADGLAVGLKPDSRAYLRRELNAEPFTEATMHLVEDLIRFLRRPDVELRVAEGHFLHAKCYLLYGGRGNQKALWDDLNPLVGIVGSSNFTAKGLMGNRELNLVHKTLLEADEIEDSQARREVEHHAQNQQNASITQENKHLLKSEVGARAIIDLTNWYESQWSLARDYKEDFIALLESSKFGKREYTPYQVYMKALYEYFKDDLDTDMSQMGTRSAVDLAEFQEDAVKKARRILAQYDGVIVADSVGLGKTWIGKKLMEDYAYHQRMKAIVICPASLKKMWENELHLASISARVITQENLASDKFDVRGVSDVDVVLVDEAHNFRNKGSKRYMQLEAILAANGRRGKGGGRKKLILLTATPINNNIFDLYNQINLFAGNDPTYFASAGIGDLYNYFLAARRESAEQGTIRIFNLLEEVVIRRTRQFIRKAYPNATIKGELINWSQRQLHTVEYDLEAAYAGFYKQIVRRIDGLHLAHYSIEQYNKQQSKDNEFQFELGRQQALVGIFKSRFLKRLESSLASFRISIERALEFVKTFAEYVQDGVILDASSFQSAMRLLNRDQTDDDSDDIPTSRAGKLDEHHEARQIIEALPHLDKDKYDARKLHKALQADIDALTSIWNDIKNLQIGRDAKIIKLKALLSNLRGQKAIIFTYYKDTAHYIEQALMSDINADWRAEMGNPIIKRIDSHVKSDDRARIIERFAPVAGGHPEWVGADDEIDILIATDVMSEGQNLQDCGNLINYDLHWNPTRMVQRAGRIDRLGSLHATLNIFNMFPERALEELLGLVQRLTAKIDIINQSGFLDASVLGEVVTPKDFNTLKRIIEEDDSVIDEQESFLELASSESLLAELQKILMTDGKQWLEDLDDGIHSGLERHNKRGIFFYFTAPRGDARAHFWRYYDIHTRKISDNRYEMMQLISCSPDTPRFPPPYHEIDIFKIQDDVMDGIILDMHQQETIGVISKRISKEQVAVAQVLQDNLNHPQYDRAELRELRKFLRQPLVGVAIKQLRESLKVYNKSNDLAHLIEPLRALYELQGGVGDNNDAQRKLIIQIQRNDLRLICYEYIWA